MTMQKSILLLILILLFLNNQETGLRVTFYLTDWLPKEDAIHLKTALIYLDRIKSNIFHYTIDSQIRDLITCLFFFSTFCPQLVAFRERSNIS